MKSRNPFYPLLLVAAVLFCVTACSYCVMMLTRTAEAAHGNPPTADGLVAFLDTHGTILLGSLLTALVVLTVAAMATDDYWARRAADRNRDHLKSNDGWPPN